MVILHAIASLDPAAGGPPQVAYRLACAQASLGHQVHVVTYSGDDHAQERLQHFIAGVTSTAEVTLHMLPPPRISERLFGQAARRFFRDSLGGKAILHLHGVWESIVRLGAQEARRQGRPYVVAPHGMLDVWSLAQKRLKKRAALMMGYRSMLNNATFLHCLNVDEARLLGPLSLRCPIRTIPNGVFAEEFARLPPAGSFRSLHPRLGEAPYVLFLSRLHYKKGLDHLADAFKVVAGQCPDVHLVVVGPDDGARAGFEAKITCAGLQGRTHVVGPLYGTQKLAALVDASVFCLPSRQEGFSMAILEAMACALPVVITENCHFPEVAEVAAGRVAPLDPRAIADALLDILTNPVARKNMGEHGRSLINARYTWPAIARLSIEHYSEADVRWNRSDSSN